MLLAFPALFEKGGYGWKMKNFATPFHVFLVAVAIDFHG